MEVCKGGRAKNPPWTNTRFHHRLERQLDILAPKKMAHVSPPGQSIVPVNPACLCQRTQLWGSLLGGRAPGRVVKRAGLPRDQPLETEGVKQCERPARLVLHTDCDSYCAGGWECLLPVWKCFASPKKAGTQSMFILNGWGWGNVRIPWKPCGGASGEEHWLRAEQIVL